MRPPPGFFRQGAENLNTGFAPNATKSRKWNAGMVSVSPASSCPCGARENRRLTTSLYRCMYPVREAGTKTGSPLKNSSSPRLPPSINPVDISRKDTAFRKIWIRRVMGSGDFSSTSSWSWAPQEKPMCPVLYSPGLSNSRSFDGASVALHWTCFAEICSDRNSLSSSVPFPASSAASNRRWNIAASSSVSARSNFGSRGGR